MTNIGSHFKLARNIKDPHGLTARAPAGWGGFLISAVRYRELLRAREKFNGEVSQIGNVDVSVNVDAEFHPVGSLHYTFFSSKAKKKKWLEICQFSFLSFSFILPPIFKQISAKFSSERQTKQRSIWGVLHPTGLDYTSTSTHTSTFPILRNLPK